MGRVPRAKALLALTAEFAAGTFVVRTTKTNFQLGSIYALATGALLATQEPFSALAAKRLPPLYFVFLTQAALLLSVPVLIARARSRHDFSALLLTPRNLGKLAILFLIGVAGLLLYNLGLRNAHPIIVAAILNLSPFWAALVAKVVSGKAVPISSLVFWPGFSVAFVGAMLIAVSQVHDTRSASPGELLDSLIHGSWKYAIPIPIFFALSGTLVGRWFRGLDEPASIAANFVVSAGILIPVILMMGGWPVPSGREGHFAALLLLVGTLAAGAAGRVIYQMALTATENDNGFVTMFFLFVPDLSSLIPFALSPWISDLHFTAGSMFFVGLGLVAAPLLVFSMKSGRSNDHRLGGPSARKARLRLARVRRNRGIFMGDQYHPLPWSVLKYDTNLGGYVVNLDKRQLEGAPAYDVGDEPAWGDRAYESKIHNYYGVGPYWAL